MTRVSEHKTELHYLLAYLILAYLILSHLLLENQVLVVKQQFSKGVDEQRERGIKGDSGSNEKALEIG